MYGQDCAVMTLRAFPLVMLSKLCLERGGFSPFPSKLDKDQVPVCVCFCHPVLYARWFDGLARSCYCLHRYASLDST